MLWSTAMSPGRDDAREPEPDDGAAIQEEPSVESGAARTLAPSETNSRQEPLAPLEPEASAALEAPHYTPHPEKRSILDWFLLRPELSRARGDVATVSREQRAYMERAKVALEFGGVAFDPQNQVASGSTVPLAPSLFQQALYWALVASNRLTGASNPTQAWAVTPPSTLATLTSNQRELEQIGRAMQCSLFELEQGSTEARRETAELLRRSAVRLITSFEASTLQLEWLKLRRLSRLALGVMLLMGPFLLAAIFWPKKPDLAKGKAWHTSSVAAECHPAKSECGGVTTDIFFHTKEESNPWFEYDFYAPLAFSSLTIRNRSDFGPERAVPLVVEVGNDEASLHEIARKTESFSTWSPSFPTQHARYLRLRTARFSLLHLEAVEVHP